MEFVYLDMGHNNNLNGWKITLWLLLAYLMGLLTALLINVMA